MYYNPYSPAQQVVRVNGEGGAMAFQLPPNSSTLLLDENEPLVWLKITDGAGYPTVKAYEIKPYEPKKQPDVSSLEERIRRLEDMINGKSDNINAE